MPLELKTLGSLGLWVLRLEIGIVGFFLQNVFSKGMRPYGCFTEFWVYRGVWVLGFWGVRFIDAGRRDLTFFWWLAVPSKQPM